MGSGFPGLKIETRGTPGVGTKPNDEVSTNRMVRG
jgi:hypothetical protein